MQKITKRLPYAGSLIVEELFAPAGYVMTAKTVYDVTIAKGEQKILEIPNDKKAQLIVTKKDAQTGQLLAGATIKATLLRANTPPFEAGQTFTETTGSDGKAIFTNLVPGEYRVEEVSPPQYYQGTSEVHTVNIPEGGSETVTLEFRNQPWTGLTIKKVDATDGHGLKGAVFKLYEGTAAESTRYLGDYQSNENGIIVVQKLESGKYYTVVEAQPPYGYFLDEENAVQTILIKPDALNGNITLIFRNQPKPRLMIEKVDAETGIRLPGASFRVSRRGSSEYVDVTTGADGTVLLEDMESDWYEVTELRAPTGYTASEEHYDIELIPGKTATLTVKNNKKPGLLIEKIDAESGVRLPGAVFRIARRGSTEFVDVTTGSNGMILVEDLEPDHYEVYEIRTPTGYVGDDTHYDVELIEGKTAELTIKNSKKPGLFLEKIDADTGARLAGAVFRVSNRSSGEYVDVTTEENGAVSVKDLEPGWYEVYELRAPTGYVLDDTHHDIELLPGKITEITVQNHKKPSLTVEKIDSMTLQPLEGVVFEIAIKNGKSLGQFQTDENGQIILKDADPDQIYLVREIRALPGYLADDTVHEFTLQKGENGVIKLQNTPEHPLLIVKKDAVTGDPIPDTVFLVTHSDGRLVGEYRTGSNGMATVTGDDVVPGWYLVKEVRANPAYISNSETKLVELKLGAPAVVEFVNKPRTGLQIRKVDDVTGEPLEGVQFKITELNGAIIGTYATDADGLINLTDREEGWVQVTEVKGLEGYKPDPAPRSIELKSGRLNVLEYQEAELPELGEGEEIDTSIPADPNVKNYSYALVDGEIYFRENSRMVKPDLNTTAKERVKGMIELRDCVQRLINYQMDDFDPISIRMEQNRLNQLYDSFTKKYGLINSRGNALAVSDDSSYYLLCSLEILDEEGNLERKADMFTKRTIKQHTAVTSVDTASEALAVSISEKARVDMEYMSRLTGKDEQTLAAELRGVIYMDFTMGSDSYRYITADEFLSGNVREKLRRYENILARMWPDDPRFATAKTNVEALRAAQPKDLEASEIDVRLGATWVDKEYIQEFMYELLDTPFYLEDEITVNFSDFTAEWNISGKSVIPYNDVAAYTTYGTERANAYRILEDTLNLRDVRIYDTVEDPDGKERRVLNQKETTLAQQKQQAIKDAFQEWIWRDPQRRQTLVRKYNDLFNATRLREYDGSHITFGGINPEIELRKHQRDAIAHVLYGGNTLLAHEVGAGKTFEMAAAAMESKRLGLCQKSLFVVPNHLTEQWASEFLRLYPSANILVATKKDFETRNRKKFCSRIATGDYDAVIIGHSQFERIPISIERQERLLYEQIDEIEEGLAGLKASHAERFSIKQLERTRKSLEARLEKLHKRERKDDVVTFEQLGVDRLFVDEAHNLIRIENALAQMPERLENVKNRLENIYRQQEAAKAELGKPFPQEEELKRKSARLAELNILLDMDSGRSAAQAARQQPAAKAERPSVLEGLKVPGRPGPGGPKKQKYEREAR